jgi:hypothetical protein
MGKKLVVFFSILCRLYLKPVVDYIYISTGEGGGRVGGSCHAGGGGGEFHLKVVEIM